MKELITTEPWPTATVGRFRNVEEVPVGSLQLLGKPVEDARWHRPLRSGVAPSGAVLIEAACGLRWRGDNGEQTRYGHHLCDLCWPRYEVAASKKLLGHYIEFRGLEFPGEVSPVVREGEDVTVRYRHTCPFRLSVLDVEDGVRTTFWGLLSGMTPVDTTNNPFADFAHQATVVFTAVAVEAPGAPELLNERTKQASTKAIQNVATRILTMSPDGREPTASEVAASLSRPFRASEAEHHDSILRRVAKAVRESDGMDWKERARQDSELGYSSGYLRVLKSQAATAGYLPPLKPRGRNGGRRRAS